MPSGMIAAAQLVAGRYKLERPLAKGGMGEVWVARHEELGIDVALKFLARDLCGTPEAEARFKREARAAAQLRSQHVVHIHDIGIHEGVPYIAMELLAGESLSERLARQGTLPLGEVVELCAQVSK